MIGWFIAWFQRFVELGLKLAAELVAGLLKAPFAAVRKGLTVRRGQPAELLELRHRVLRKGMPRETARFSGDEEASTRHWVAVQEGLVVGVASVMQAAPPEPLAWPGEPGALSPSWQLRGMAVDEAFQGQDIGRELLLGVHREVAEPMWCNARLAVVGFYEKNGWVAVGQPFELPDIGPHRRMLWRPTAASARASAAPPTVQR